MQHSDPDLIHEHDIKQSFWVESVLGHNPLSPSVLN